MMTNTITTIQLLEFLAKADKVSSHVTITEENGVYDISIHADWDDNNHFYNQIVSIIGDAQVSWDNSEHSFFYIDEMLDELVEREEEREMKRQKCQELLSRLTDEEKELLGVE